MIEIYTDGSCKKNPGAGTWGFVVVDKIDNSDVGKIVFKSGGYSEMTTNNIMELTGMIEAIKYSLGLPNPIRIYCDSQYVVKGYNEWLPGWKRKGWRTSKGKVENEAVWRVLDDLMANHPNKPRLVWVRGHNGNTWNEAVDQYINELYEEKVA